MQSKRLTLYLLDKPTTASAVPLIHDNFTNRLVRCIIQISALSTYDGRIEAYHGRYG